MSAAAHILCFVTEAPDGNSNRSARRGRFIAVGRWRGLFALALGLVAIGLLIWSFALEPWAVGSTPEWLAGLGSSAAVAVALWQSVVLRRQAEQEAATAADRFQRDLDAANARMDRDIAAAEERHRVQLEAQRDQMNTELAAAETRHRVELQQQRELARVQRVHLREQEFKMAMIRITRAINTVTHTLATLSEDAKRAVDIAERDGREDALLFVSKTLDLAVQDVQAEVSGAHMLTRNDDLHEALNRVIRATLGAPMAEMTVRRPVINERRLPTPDPIPQAMSAMQTAVGAARQLAGDLLDTGWE